ncbi:MAG: hypothetical protein KatS3mg108_2052 [Isosphaeraceae bacterium]|jgi:GlpG protein|nr:MAG: hypothetical protein KatS3mg108_2052 [Isosphaeraceae bacterium]
MRQIGILPDEQLARRLVDYLLTQEIEAEVRPTRDTAWGIWVVKEDHVEAGRRELDAFQADPNAARYLDAVHAARNRRRAAEQRQREHARSTIELRDQLNVISLRRCPVVHLLILVSVLVALLTGFGRNYRDLAPFFLAPPASAVPPLVDGRPVQVVGGSYLEQPSVGLRPLLRGEVWRLFTPMFIHFGLAHLVFNMLALYGFGGLIELRKGSWTLLALVLAACPVSFLTQYVWDIQVHGPERMGLPGGMSGVVYALFGYCWMRGEYEPESGLRIPNGTIVWMFLWLALCGTGALGAIANAAHVGGLVLGMGIGLGPYLFAPPRAEG